MRRDGMRILQISNFTPPMESGHGNYCLSLSAKLASLGFKVTILSSRYPSWAPSREEVDGVEVIRLWTPFLGWNISGMNLALKAVMDLGREADVVHVHSYLFIMSNQAGVAKLFTGFPCVLHLHGGIGLPDRKLVGWGKYLFKKLLYDPLVGRFMSWAADYTLSVSRRDLLLAKWRLGVDLRRAAWAPPGVDLERFSLNHRSDGFTLGFIGRLEPWKGAMLLPEILKVVLNKVPDAKLVVIGDGGLYESLKSKLSGLPAELLGRVSNRRIPEVLQEIDVLLLPSTLEGLPLTCIEAAAAGVPAVAFNVGSVSEVIEDGRTGFLVEAGDYRKLAEKAALLLENPELREKMGREARRKAEREFSWEKTVRTVLKAYSEAVKAAATK